MDKQVKFTIAALNERAWELVNRNLEKVYDTDKEREFMISLTLAGIESAKTLLDIVKTGITYETWKEFVINSNSCPAARALVNDNQADLDALIQEIHAADLHDDYNAFLAESFFTPDKIEESIRVLEKQLARAKIEWDREDAQDKEISSLTQLADSLAKQEADDK